MSTSHEVTQLATAIDSERMEGIVVTTSHISERVPAELSDLLGGVDTTAPSEPETHAVTVRVGGSERVQARDERLDGLVLVCLWKVHRESPLEDVRTATDDRSQSRTDSRHGNLLRVEVADRGGDLHERAVEVRGRYGRVLDGHGHDRDDLTERTWDRRGRKRHARSRGVSTIRGTATLKGQGASTHGSGEPICGRVRP